MKRVICFSPHPDDDVISMGGILRKLVENENEIAVAYMTSGNIAVFDHDAQQFADFVTEYNRIFGSVGVGNLNGDGIPDLVVEEVSDCTGAAPNYLSIKLGNGDGSFQLAEITLTARPLDPAAKDQPIAVKLKPAYAAAEDKDQPLANATDGKPATAWVVRATDKRDNAPVLEFESPLAGFPGGTSFPR